MAAEAGERAQKTGDFHCAKCSEKVLVTKGDKIPKCPSGHTEFEAGPGSRRQDLGRLRSERPAARHGLTDKAAVSGATDGEHRHRGTYVRRRAQLDCSDANCHGRHAPRCAPEHRRHRRPRCLGRLVGAARRWRRCHRGARRCGEGHHAKGPWTAGAAGELDDQRAARWLRPVAGPRVVRGRRSP